MAGKLVKAAISGPEGTLILHGILTFSSWELIGVKFVEADEEDCCLGLEAPVSIPVGSCSS